MKTYDPNQPLISIHIPKTGGTSFREILETWFGSNLLFHYFSERYNRMPEKYSFRPGICIHGHYNKKRNFGIRDYYPDAGQFITILRDPFEILLSHYFYFKKLERRDKAFRNGKKQSLPGSVNQFIEDEMNKIDYHPNILDYMPGEMSGDNYETLMDEQFIYIGLIDDLQYSVEQIARRLGFSPVSIDRVNISPRFQDVAPSLRGKNSSGGMN